MGTYRVLWLIICVALGAIGAAMAFFQFLVAVVFLFVVSGMVGSLLLMFLIGDFWEAFGLGRFRFLAGGALVAGTSVAVFVGYVSLLGPGVFLFATAVLVGLPYAVKAFSRWI